MNLLIIGINHTSAPIELRERVAFTAEQLEKALPDLIHVADLNEVAILSTCNRTEIIAAAEKQSDLKVIHWLANYHAMSFDDLKSSIYIKSNHDAAHHNVRVACGLDSMVVGEPQILGQMKDAYELANQIGTLGKELHYLLQNTFRIAKRIRSETEIGVNSVSLASTAVTLAELIFSELKDRNVLLIGAGATSRLVGRHLKSSGFVKLTIANRSIENAIPVAEELNAIAIDFKAIPSCLSDADIVIASTASQLPILGKGLVERAIKSRKHRPILMIDLAVPRDIEPEVGALRDIYLYSIDDLQEIIDANLNNRLQSAEKAERIISDEIRLYRSPHEYQDIEKTLLQFRTHHESIKAKELARALDRLRKGGSPEEIMKQFANQLTSKLLHKPTLRMRDGDKNLLHAISKLYLLGDDPIE